MGERIEIGEANLELGGPMLGELRSSDPATPIETLRQRLEDDGYLLLRGLVPRSAVCRGRDTIYGALAAEGRLDPDSPVELGRVGVGEPGGTNLMKEMPEHPDVLAVLEAPELAGFFASLLGEEVITTKHKWLRAVPPGNFTPAHMDNVYMGRGSRRLHTSWVPFCDLPLGMGGLVVLSGSHRLDSFRKVRDTYGQMDVDRDLHAGWFTKDPVEVVQRYGGRWLTGAFECGDIMVFGMHTMHMSQTNRFDRFRITADVRWQPASDPVDERWFGEKPLGHYAWGDKSKHKPIELARAEWGV